MSLSDLRMLAYDMLHYVPVYRRELSDPARKDEAFRLLDETRDFDLLKFLCDKYGHTPELDDIAIKMMGQLLDLTPTNGTAYELPIGCTPEQEISWNGYTVVMRNMGDNFDYESLDNVYPGIRDLYNTTLVYRHTYGDDDIIHVAFASYEPGCDNDPYLALMQEQGIQAFITDDVQERPTKFIHYVGLSIKTTVQ